MYTIYLYMIYIIYLWILDSIGMHNMPVNIAVM